MDSRASSISIDSLIHDEFEFDFELLEFEGLSHWELLNASDADSEDRQNDDRCNDFNDLDHGEVLDSVRDGDFPVISVPFMGEYRINSHHDENLREVYHLDYDCKGNSESDHNEDDDGGDDGDGYDLDDELMPWSVSGKFQRERMRKLGKRAFPKMYNSKKSPYLFVRPGCVRGKHGLGLKHN